MDAPPVQYVKTSDGYDIAYAVSGSGPPLVALGSTGIEHIQVAWKTPVLEDWLLALTSRFQLVQIDRRGSGLSTRGLPTSLTMDDFQQDIDAVVSHLGLDRFFLYGTLYHLAFISVQYAVEHADSVLGLILVGAGTSLSAARAPALIDTVSGQDWEFFLRSLALVGRGAESAEEIDAAVERYMQCWHQEDFFMLTKANANTEIGERLSRLTIPTLVIHPRGYKMLTEDVSASIARLARAKLVSVDGRHPTDLSVEQGMRAVENFLAGLGSLVPEGTTSGPGALPASLSLRELEVLRLLAAGRSNQQIADQLVISLHTVRHHVSNIFNKIGVANRTEAAGFARENGLH